MIYQLFENPEMVNYYLTTFSTKTKILRDLDNSNSCCFRETERRRTNVEKHLFLPILLILRNRDDLGQF